MKCLHLKDQTVSGALADNEGNTIIRNVDIYWDMTRRNSLSKFNICVTFALLLQASVCLPFMCMIICFNDI
jgi:hypothetical protein